MRVLLIQMPFFTLDTASISLSLIKAALDRADVACDLKYFNLEFGKRLGAGLYGWIAGNSPQYLLFGDLVFVSSLHGVPLPVDRVRALAEPLATPGVPVIPEEILEAFEDIEKAAAEFIEDKLESIDWANYDLVGFNTMFQIAPVLAMARHIKGLPHPPRIIPGRQLLRRRDG